MTTATLHADTLRWYQASQLRILDTWAAQYQGEIRDLALRLQSQKFGRDVVRDLIDDESTDTVFWHARQAAHTAALLLDW